MIHFRTVNETPAGFDPNHEDLRKAYRNARAAKDGCAGKRWRELRQYVAHLLEQHKQESKNG